MFTFFFQEVCIPILTHMPVFYVFTTYKMKTFVKWQYCSRFLIDFISVIAVCITRLHILHPKEVRQLPVKKTTKG